MKGYWNNEAATRETVDGAGWLHTGDVAYYDDDHYFYIVDRTKELIKVKGNQVYIISIKLNCPVTIQRVKYVMKLWDFGLLSESDVILKLSKSVSRCVRATKESLKSSFFD